MIRNVNEVLSRSDIEQIHQTSMKLMANVGVEFPDEDAVAVFKKHGFNVDGYMVYFDENQVMKFLETVPKQFTIHARNPERSVTVGDGVSVFAPAYGAPFLVDHEVGKREPTIDDYHALVKLAHELPNQDLSGYLLVEPSDVAPREAHLHMLYAHMLHSDKAFIGSAEGKLGAQHTMEMASILFGEKVGARPVTVGLINSLSPLSYSDEMLQAMMEYARWKQPVIIAALAMAGSTGPVTLAGVLAMQDAELLAGVVLTQLINPGTPVLFGSTSTNIDMRTGSLALGGPELSLMVAAHAQLARYYGLPSRSGGALADASTPDAQAGYESMLALLTTVNNGIDFVLHSGGILNSYLAFSAEKLVLDDEMCGIVRRFQQGIEVSPDTLAYDVIVNVGPGNNFLMEDQTLERCRTEFWQPDVGDRGGVEAWMASGRQTAADRAYRRWQKLVAEHEDPALDETTLRQLQAYVEEHK